MQKPTRTSALYLQAFADLSGRKFYVLLPFPTAVLVIGRMPDTPDAVLGESKGAIDVLRHCHVLAVDVNYCLDVAQLAANHPIQCPCSCT